VIHLIYKMLTNMLQVLVSKIVLFGIIQIML